MCLMKVFISHKKEDSVLALAIQRAFVKNGVPPTLPKARTGEFTPPEIYFFDSLKSSLDVIIIAFLF